MGHRMELPSDWAYMFDVSSVACVEYLNASNEYFAKETDQNHLNYTRRFAVALKYIFLRPCTDKERVRNERNIFFPIRRFRQVAFKMRK